MTKNDVIKVWRKIDIFPLKFYYNHKIRCCFIMEHDIEIPRVLLCHCPICHRVDWYFRFVPSCRSAHERTSSLAGWAYGLYVRENCDGFREFWSCLHDDRFVLFERLHLAHLTNKSQKLTRSILWIHDEARKQDFL